MGRFLELSSLWSGLQKRFWFQYKEHILYLIKNTNIRHFKTIVGYIFSKNVHCDMRILDVKIGALLCFLNGFGIAVLVFRY